MLNKCHQSMMCCSQLIAATGRRLDTFFLTSYSVTPLFVACINHGCRIYISKSANTTKKTFTLFFGGSFKKILPAHYCIESRINHTFYNLNFIFSRIKLLLGYISPSSTSINEPFYIVYLLQFILSQFRDTYSNA